MKLTWYGHACLRVESSDGLVIVTDPYNPATSGYQPIREPADIVVMSSSTDSFHNNAQLVPGDPLVIDALELALAGGRRVEGGVPFAAVAAMEALDHYAHDPDQNALYRFEVDGIRIGHMGDVGNPLSPEQLDFFRGLDVLLALTGGHPTIALDDLKTAIDVTRPRLVVPMHFRTLRLKLRNTAWIHEFLDYFATEQVDFAFSETVVLNRDMLPDETRVLVLDYA